MSNAVRQDTTPTARGDSSEQTQIKNHVDGVLAEAIGLIHFAKNNRCRLLDRRGDLQNQIVKMLCQGDGNETDDRKRTMTYIMDRADRSHGQKFIRER